MAGNPRLPLPQCTDISTPYLLTSLSSSFESILTADCLFWEIHSSFCTRPSFSTESPISRSLGSISRYSRKLSGCSRGRSGTILMFMKNPRTVNGWHAGCVHPGARAALKAGLVSRLDVRGARLLPARRERLSS